jgi:hypothetical protein
MVAATCSPSASDKMGEDFDAIGHLSPSVFSQVGVTPEADVYVCGPPRFTADMKEALATVGVAPERIHVELFNGSESMTPGVIGAATSAPHLPKDDAETGPLVSFARSGIAAHWNPSAYHCILELARRATSRSVGRAGPVFVTTVRVVWFRVMLFMNQSHSKRQPSVTSRLLFTADWRCRHRFVKLTAARAAIQVSDTIARAHRSNDGTFMVAGAEET